MRSSDCANGAGAITMAVLALVLPAAAVEVQPGLWEIVSKTERNGVAGATESKTSCLSAEQSKKLSEMSPRPAGLKEGCETVNAQRTHNGFSVHVQCRRGASVDLTTTYVFDGPGHFTGVMKSTVTAPRRVDTVTLTVEGRRIGECPR